MAAIIAGSIDVTKIPKDKLFKGEKGLYLDLSIVVNDESRYGNNVSISVGQTKEERENKVDKIYLGNAKVIWTDNKVSLAQKDGEETPDDKSQQMDDLYGDLDF